MKQVEETKTGYSDDLVDTTLIYMLGRNALNNDFQVSPDIARACKAVKYLIVQMRVIEHQYGVSDDVKDYISDVIKCANQILEDKVE